MFPFAQPGSDGAPVRVAFYARFSDDSQGEGYSIEAQHEKYEREALAHPEWRVTFYDERPRSAFVRDESARPMFSQLLQDARDGKIDLVVVHRLDRWSRRFLTTMNTLEELRRCGVGFLSLEERFDLTSPFGWLTMHNFGGLAQYYSMNLSTRVRSGHAERARHGLHAGHVAFGYRYTGRKTPAAKDREGDWEGLEKVFEWLLAGYTNGEASDAINADGRWTLSGPQRRKAGTKRAFQRCSIQQIRTNVYYRPFQPGDTNGTILHNGVEYRGQHEAAVSWDAWHAMQEMGKGRRRGNALQRLTNREGLRVEAPYTAEFRGLIVCAGCGHPLWSTRSPQHHGQDYERYRCHAYERGETCPYSGNYAYVVDVRELWCDWLERHTAWPSGWRAEVRLAVAEMARRGGTDERAPDPVRVLRERELWERKRQAAIHLFFEGEIDKAAYEARLSECDQRLADLAAAAVGVEQHTTRLLDAGAMLVDMAEIWRTAGERLANSRQLDPALIRSLTLELQRNAGMLLEPRGLLVAPLGRRGRYNKHQKFTRRPLSCELERVTLRAPYADLMRAFEGAAEEAQVG